MNENFKLCHMILPLWNKFDVIILNKNHRQGEDQVYAELLNRAREGKLNEEDISLLQTRVRPRNHPDIPENTLTVTCINKKVNKINEEMLSQINGEEFSIDATIISETQKSVNPLLDSSGAIRNTPLQKNLKLKIGSKVMLTYNVNTIDSLTNGTFGEMIDLKVDKRNEVCKVIVHFFDEECGKQKRKKMYNYSQLIRRYLQLLLKKLSFLIAFQIKVVALPKMQRSFSFP